MRDLLNLFDTLSESRGLSARKPGEIYARIGGEADEDKITFQSLDFYPESGAYTSTEEMMDVLDQLETHAGIKFEKINQPTARTKAFGVAGFDTAVGRRYLVKFAADIKPVRTQNTFFQTKDIPGGFSQTDARGSKEKVGYKPSDVLTEFKSQTPATILAQIAEKFGEDSDEYNAAVIIVNAQQFPVLVPAGNMDFKGFRDYFCEMLQPCVLINGAPVKGNAGKAAAVFMGQNGFSDCVVSFNTNVSGTLYDSLLINPEGKQIKLSSKGAKGAMASVINLLKSARELEDAGLGDIVAPYQEIIDILKIIDNGDHNSGPLELAIDQKMITPDEAEEVMSLKQYAGQKFDIDNTNLTDNLKAIYKERTAEDPSKVVPLNHMVASIAYKVCNEINTKTNFSEAAADILNNSAFVQMYTDASQKGDQFVLKGFTTVWPSKLFTDVTLEAQKSYSSTTSSGGKLVFNINKEPKAVPNVEQGATTDAPGPSRAGELVDYIPPRSNIKASDTKTKAPGDTETLGRKRRRSF
jgi:hypothetical protein